MPHCRPADMNEAAETGTYSSKTAFGARKSNLIVHSQTAYLLEKRLVPFASTAPWSRRDLRQQANFASILGEATGPVDKT
jgi:hypothetical protein